MAKRSAGDTGCGKRTGKLHLKQRTLARPVQCSGIGIHSGQQVNLTIHPAPPNHGIQFRRTDLLDSPSISGIFSMVVDTSLATVIGYNGFIVSTVEHLMACLAGLSIDNALVEIDAYEMPIMDGSAGPFARLIREAGVRTQDSPRCFFVITQPIELKADDKSVGLYPYPGFRISYTIDFDHPLIGRQFYTFDLDDEGFEREVSHARTFGFFNEYEQLKRYGLSRGGSLENVVVMDENQILNPDGLRYSDEFVRHKILDCFGDLSLLGMPVMGHLVARKSGHAFNHAFLRKFFDSKQDWKTQSFVGNQQPRRTRPKSLAI